MKTDLNCSDELSGKIALVTGGTKGAGKAIAQRLQAAGATVITTARNKPEDGDQQFKVRSTIRCSDVLCRDERL